MWAEHLCICVSAWPQAWVHAQLWLWSYLLMHCRPCFFWRVLLQSEQVAQLEKAPATNWCPLLWLRSLSLASLSFSFSFCCSFSRFLPCRGTRRAKREGRGGVYMQNLCVNYHCSTYWMGWHLMAVTEEMICNRVCARRSGHWVHSNMQTSELFHLKICCKIRNFNCNCNQYVPRF